MNLIAPFGFFGVGNIGDEATLQGFARLVAMNGNGFHAWIASRNPSHTANIEPSFKYYSARERDLRWRWAKFRAAAHIFVGGTPIMDVLGAWPLNEVAALVSAAHRVDRPVVFIGAGTERLKREESRSILSDVVAPRVLHWSVRSSKDRDRLTEYGVPLERITEAADLAWTLDAVPADFGKNCLRDLGIDLSEPLVGVNINSEDHIIAQEPRFFEKLAHFLDVLVEEHHVRIVFLCNEVREDRTFDKAASRETLAAMKHRARTLLVPNNYWSPQQMCSLIASCEVTLSTRYHFCLFSALQGVPFIALKRSDKVEDLCSDLNWPFGVSLAEVDVSQLLPMASEMRQRAPSLAALLKERVQVMKQKAVRNQVALDRLQACRN
jgi:polysaccharide pyruvyl transferase WcaK-like protein